MDSFLGIKRLSVFLYKNPLFIGLLLLFILPPFGVVVLGSIGILHIIRKIRGEDVFPINIVTLFFVVLFTNSLVASLNHHIIGYIHVPVMIISYYGLYLYVIENLKEEEYIYFKWTMIAGSIYIYIFDKIHRGLMALGVHFGDLNYLMGSIVIGGSPTKRLYGSTYNPNFAAYFLLMSLAFLLSYLLHCLRYKLYNNILLTSPILIILVIGITETGSRAGFITMSLLILAFIMKYNWRLLPLIVTVLLLKFKAFYELIPRVDYIDPGFDKRLLIWKNSIKIFLKNFQVGVTPAGFKYAYHNLPESGGEYIPHAHNIILSFFAEYGFLGGVFFLIVLFYAGYKWMQLMVYKHNSMMSEWLLLSVPIIFLTGIWDYPLYSPQVALPTIMLFSIFHRYTREFQFSTVYSKLLGRTKREYRKYY